MVRKLFMALFLMVFGASMVGAQTHVRLQPVRTSGVLDSSSDFVELSAEGLGGFGSVSIQTLDTYVGTWEVQCSVSGDSADFDADDVLILQRKNSSSTATEVSDIVGIWTVTNAAGCRKIRVQATAGFSGVDTEVAIEATQTGGAGGGGGGGVAGTVAISQAGTDNDVDATLQFTLTESDDDSIAAGQAADAALTLPYMYNGSAWVRTTGTTANGLDVDVTRVGGTVAVTQSGTWDEVGINDSGNSITVDNGGTFAVQIDAGAVTSLALIDDPVFADDAAFTLASSKVMMSGAIRDDDLAALTAIEGDAVPLRVDASGALHVTGGLAYDTGTDSNRSLLVDENGDPITFAVDPVVSEAVTWADTQIGVVSLCRASAGAPTAVTADDANAFWCGLSGETIIAGTVAHDGADSGNPISVGYRAIAHGTNPTAVAAADRTVGYANRAGIPFYIGGHPNTKTIEVQEQDADNGQTDTAIVSCSTGCKVVVTYASATCDPDTTDDTNVRVGFGTASVPAGADTGTNGVILAHDGLPPGGGISKGNGAGILGVGADDEDLRVTIGDPAGGSCNVFVSYYTIES